MRHLVIDLTFIHVKLCFIRMKAAEKLSCAPPHPCTYISVLAVSSHPLVDAVDGALRPNNQRSASVHNSLATTVAGHNLTIDSNTRRDIWHVSSRAHTLPVTSLCSKYILEVLWWWIFSFTCQL